MTSLPSSKPRPDGAGVSGTAVLPDEPIRALLAGIVDYAGLFPPAELDMHSAARAYETYLHGEHAWMLGAFVVPAARLDELGEAAARWAGEHAWPISVLAPSADEAARALAALPTRWGGRFEVRAVEIAPQSPKRIREGVDVGEWGAEAFHEAPLDDDQEARLDAIADAGAAAKVRTGGVAAHAFPHTVLLADFLRSCAERGVPFKATAGLHHPLRGRYPLTYAPRSLQCEMFGFLEVALAAALLWRHHVDMREAAVLLGEERSPVAVEPDAFLWSGHRLSVHEIEDARARFFRSFGSCSFEEPVTGLMALGLV
jgi:hypothetical protein